MRVADIHPQGLHTQCATCWGLRRSRQRRNACEAGGMGGRADAMAGQGRHWGQQDTAQGVDSKALANRPTLRGAACQLTTG